MIVVVVDYAVVDDVFTLTDGAWINADADFGAPQFLNWNWPLYDKQGKRREERRREHERGRRGGEVSH